MPNDSQKTLYMPTDGLRSCNEERKGQRTLETTVNGLRIQYELRGEQHDTDTVALFLHGWGSRGALFGLQLDVAAERFLTLAPDLPGFGGSDEPREAWSVDGYADFVLSFLEQWKPKTVLLFGHSFGGRVSIKLCARRDLPFHIGKAVLFDAAGIPPKRSLRKRLRTKTYKLGRKFLSLPPVKKCFPDAAEQFRRSHGSADYNAASPIMRQCLVKAVNEDLTSCLPSIACPTLLIWGGKDTATPLSDGQKMEKLIPDAGLVTLANAGHFSFADDPATCARVVRVFLDS